VSAPAAIAFEDGQIAARMFGLNGFCPRPAWAKGGVADAWQRGYDSERSEMASRVARATLA
jgi:hypothetical protein